VEVLDHRIEEIARDTRLCHAAILNHLGPCFHSLALCDGDQSERGRLAPAIIRSATAGRRGTRASSRAGPSPRGRPCGPKSGPATRI
jgi:hypothetical protein